MVMYATASELASYMQQDLDSSTATLVLELASAEFARAAGTQFAPTEVAYTTTGTSATRLTLPYGPVSAVSAVRLNGVTVAADYTRIGSTLYRTAGFGDSYAFPPDTLEVDLTYGYASVPGDVKAAVLETAAQAYSSPVAVVQESVDDYSVRYAAGAGGVRLTAAAEELALSYRGPVFA